MTNESFDPRVADWLRREAPPAASGEVLARIVARTRDVPQRGRLSLWAHSRAAPARILVAVAAVIAAVVLLVPNLLAPPPVGPGPSPADSIAPTLPSPSESAGPAETPAPASTPSPDGAPDTSEEWAVVELPNPAPGSYQGGVPADVVAGGPGLVAVGSARPCCAEVTYDDEPWQVGIWTSPDGLDWNLVPDLDTFGRAGLVAVALDPQTGRMLAVGYEIPPPIDTGHGGTIWRSENGIDWIGVEGAEGIFHDVLRVPSGWVIGGTVDGSPAVLTSEDLGSWTTTLLDGEGRVEHLAVAADGRIAAFGCRTEGSESSCDPVAWSSPDGDTWAEGTIDALRIEDVTAWRGGFVATGHREPGTSSRSWISSDGTSWEAGPEIRGASIAAVIEVDGRLIAGGSAPGDNGIQAPRLWVSDDGLEWEALTEPTPAQDQTSGFIRTLVALPDRIIALGGAFFIDGSGPIAWTSER